MQKKEGMKEDNGKRKGRKKGRREAVVEAVTEGVLINKSQLDTPSLTLRSQILIREVARAVWWAVLCS